MIAQNRAGGYGHAQAVSHQSGEEVSVSMVDLKHAAAIVGIHEHVTRYAPDKSELQIQGESVIKALGDAGLTKQDVDGLLTASSSARNTGLNLADYLNMYPRFVDNTTVGGGSFEFHLSHALNAIVAGRLNCAVITYSSLARSSSVSVGTGGVARFGHPRLEPSPDSFEELYGLTTVGLYAMIAQRHMHLYGTTSEQLAEIASRLGIERPVVDLSGADFESVMRTLEALPVPAPSR